MGSVGAAAAACEVQFRERSGHVWRYQTSAYRRFSTWQATLRSRSGRAANGSDSICCTRANGTSRPWRAGAIMGLLILHPISSSLLRAARRPRKADMELIAVLGTAVGLAMDAFAVALAASVSLRTVSRRQIFRFAFHFGLFQAMMPVIGWLAGRAVSSHIRGWDHWAAFGLLAFVGGRAI